MASTLGEDLIVRGAVSCASFNVSSASINNSMITTPGSGGDYIGAAKIKPRVPVGTAQADGTLSTGEARLFSAYAAGSIVQLNISCDTAPTSSDTVIVDLLKSTAGGAYASVLSSTYTLNSSSVNRTVYQATISGTSFIAEDLYKVTWTVSGTSAADLCITLYADVNPS